MPNHTINLGKLQAKKVLGLKLAESFHRLGMPDRASRIEQCGTFLEISTTPEGDKLTAANFCRERLCPACSWRRSIRIFATTSQILDHLDKTDPDVKYLFLTLTVRNCPPEQLGATLDTMADAYNRLRNNRAWKRRVKGAMKTMEITINHETGTCHPHYHLILVVSKDYARKGSKTYWTHEEWQEAWRKSARLDYDPQVSIEAVKGRRQGTEEMSKYLAKDSDYILPDDPERTDQMVTILQQHLAGRRLISYTGCMLQAQRALKLANPEEGPLVDDLRGDVACAIKRYHWSTGLRRYLPGLPTEERRKK